MCVEAVSLTHRFSIANPFIRVDAIRWGAFEELAASLQVDGVPALVINRREVILGEFDEGILLGIVQRAAGLE